MRRKGPAMELSSKMKGVAAAAFSYSRMEFLSKRAPSYQSIGVM